MANFFFVLSPPYLVYLRIVSSRRPFNSSNNRTRQHNSTCYNTHSYKAAASHRGTLSSKQNFELHSLRCMIPTRRMFYRDGYRVAFSSFKLVMRARPAEKTKISDSSCCLTFFRTSLVELVRRDAAYLYTISLCKKLHKLPLKIHQEPILKKISLSHIRR